MCLMWLDIVTLTSVSLIFLKFPVLLLQLGNWNACDEDLIGF